MEQTKIEKKAEEYTNSINTIIYDIEDNAINIAKYLRKAYLDGLAEGRKEKWHGLRKDPNDLPKKDGQYWCYVDNEHFDNYGFVYFCDGEWAVDRTQVIAWCELPKFEE